MGATTGTVIIRQRLESRVVVAEIDEVRIWGYETAPEQFEAGSPPVYGPRTLPKAEEYILDDVPVAVNFIRLEYLQDGSVRGIFTQAVEIEPGVAFEIVDPDYTDLAGLFESLVIEFPAFIDDLKPPGEPVYHVMTGEQWPFFTARGIPETGSGVDLTSYVAWESSDPGILRMINAGDSPLFQPGHGEPGQGGLVTVTATFIDLSATIECEIFYPPVPWLGQAVIVQDGGTLTANSETQLTVLGTFSDGSIRDITEHIEWISGDPSLLTFDPQVPGLALTGNGPGGVRVRGFYRDYRFAFYGFFNVSE